MKIQLVLTCGGCPEQYDAFYDGVKIGYMRLRHGFFYVEYLGNNSRKVAYSDEPEGDGSFAKHERHFQLNQACEALLREHGQPPDPLYEITNEEDRFTEDSQTSKTQREGGRP